LLQKKNMKDIQPNDVFKTEKWDDIYIINAQEQENYALNVLKGFIESIQKNKAFDSDDPISLVHDRKYD
jgi:cupin superfamily acireductone dioxygenase involved in methionine salvage